MRIKSIEVKADLGVELVKPPYINHNPQIANCLFSQEEIKVEKEKFLQLAQFSSHLEFGFFCLHHLLVPWEVLHFRQALIHFRYRAKDLLIWVLKSPTIYWFQQPSSSGLWWKNKALQKSPTQKKLHHMLVVSSLPNLNIVLRINLVIYSFKLITI